MSFEEAIEKMEDQAREKHSDLNQAHRSIKNLEKHLGLILDRGSSPGGYEKSIDQLKEEFDKIVDNLESAKDAQGNIEGLREQAEDTLRKQLNDMEEFGSAEERARRITADAEAKLMQLEQDNQLEEYKEAIEEIEDEYGE